MATAEDLFEKEEGRLALSARVAAVRRAAFATVPAASIETHPGAPPLSRWRRVARALFYAPMARAIAATRFRFVTSKSEERPGPFAAELDLLFKEIALGRRPKIRPIYLFPSDSATRAVLAEIWRRKIWVARSRFATRLLAPFLEYPQIVHALDAPMAALDPECCARPEDRLAMAPATSPLYAAALAAWGGRAPIAALPAWMRDEGRSALRRWGMRTGGWFVCVKSRDIASTAEDAVLFRPRSANINAFRLAMEEIVAQGGFVVRIGDPSMQPLPKMPGVYDFAHSEERTPHLYAYLAAECRFYLGAEASFASVARVFGRPCALVDLAPAGSAPGVGPRDVSILGLYEDEGGRSFSFRDVFEAGVAQWRRAEAFRAARMRVAQNSPEEIRDLVLEMIERDEKRFVASDEDLRLQQRFRSYLTPCDAGFGSGAHIGRAFLRKNAERL